MRGTTQTALVLAGEHMINSPHTCVLHILATATIQDGINLFQLCSYYWRVVTVQGQRLFEEIWYVHCRFTTL